MTVLDEGGERTLRVKLVDWEHPERNDFLAVNQFRVVVGQKNRRPDIVLFVNGLPLGEIEVKDPGDPRGTPEGAANYAAHLVETIPKLYRFVELVGVSDLIQARLGTISTPAEHFAEWKTMDPARVGGPLGARRADRRRVRAHTVPRPDPQLRPVRGVGREGGEGRRRSTTRSTRSTGRSRRRPRRWPPTVAPGWSGTRRGRGRATRWSSTSGSSVADPRFENPTVVAVTDRTDLDTQLHETFARQRALAPAVRAGGVDRRPDACGWSGRRAGSCSRRSRSSSRTGRCRCCRDGAT